MSKPEKLFVVVDPSDTVQIALERALIMGKKHEVPPELFLFVGVDGEAVDLRAVNDNLFRKQEWFMETIRKPVEDAGMSYTLEVSWSREWQKSILQSAKRWNAERIYLPVHERTNNSRFTFSEAKWGILKSADCPVVLIQPGAKPERKTIVAAVNFQARLAEQQKLNESIIYWGNFVAEKYGANFHVVNAYLDSMHYPDRGKLAREAKISSDNIHVEQGYTSDVVGQVAKRLDADLVVMGTLGQTGQTTTRRGNTAERVIAALTQDVMVINH